MGGTVAEYRLEALTDIWTGDINRKNTRLITTGLLGSIRWWFEVLVRGLGGHACDPTSRHSCPKQVRDEKSKQKQERHCVICELFGCTGWARKFRFQARLENEQGGSKDGPIECGDIILLRFIELRPIRPEEWTLLDATLRLIADYGAIGGKTVLKPSKESEREDEEHHKDYGLVHLIEFPPQLPKTEFAKVKKYIDKWQGPPANNRNIAWASLQNFWFVKGEYLARKKAKDSTFNKVLCRPPEKYNSQKGNSWLAGSLGVSKKVFSFKNPPRTFGFVNHSLSGLSQMKSRLEAVWESSDFSWHKGEQIIKSIWGER